MLPKKADFESVKWLFTVHYWLCPAVVGFGFLPCFTMFLTHILMVNSHRTQSMCMMWSWGNRFLGKTFLRYLGPRWTLTRKTLETGLKCWLSLNSIFFLIDCAFGWLFVPMCGPGMDWWTPGSTTPSTNDYLLILSQADSQNKFSSWSITNIITVRAEDGNLPLALDSVTQMCWQMIVAYLDLNI